MAWWAAVARRLPLFGYPALCLFAAYEVLLVLVFLQLAWGALAELVHVSVYHEANAVVQGGIIVMSTVEAVF